MRKNGPHLLWKKSYHDSIAFCLVKIRLVFLLIRFIVRSKSLIRMLSFFFGLSPFGNFMNSFIDQSYFWFVAEYLFLRFGLVYVTCSDSIHFSCYLFRQDFKLSTVPMGLDLQWNNFALNKSCTWRFPTFSWLWMWLQAKSWIDVVGVERTLIKRIPFFYWNGCIDVKGQSEIRLVKVGHLWRYLVQTSLIAFECYTTEDAERRCHFINWSWTLTILIMIVTG